MADRTRVTLETDSEEAQWTLITEYAMDAVYDLPELPACDRAFYLPGGSTTNVWLDIRGDVEAIVEQETSRWDDLVSEGLSTGWHVEQYPLEAMPGEYEALFGKQGADLWDQLLALSSRLSRSVEEEFAELPAPVDEYPDEESPARIGWWALLHALTEQMGYSLDDEFDAHLEGMRTNIENMARVDGAERANRRLDDLEEELDNLREQVDTGPPSEE